MDHLEERLQMSFQRGEVSCCQHHNKSAHKSPSSLSHPTPSLPVPQDSKHLSHPITASATRLPLQAPITASATRLPLQAPLTPHHCNASTSHTPSLQDSHCKHLSHPITASATRLPLQAPLTPHHCKTPTASTSHTPSLQDSHCKHLSHPITASATRLLLQAPLTPHHSLEPSSKGMGKKKTELEITVCTCMRQHILTLFSYIMTRVNIGVLLLQM